MCVEIKYCAYKEYKLECLEYLFEQELECSELA